jgi:hypothetical protein
MNERDPIFQFSCLIVAAAKVSPSWRTITSQYGYWILERSLEHQRALEIDTYFPHDQILLFFNFLARELQPKLLSFQ